MQGPIRYAFNSTRGTYLATELAVADGYWSRLRGLMGAAPKTFPSGCGLWITPSHGVHTFAMRFPIDVAYLDSNKSVVYMAYGLKPWRVAPISLKTSSVIELSENSLKASGTTIGDEIEIALGKTREIHA